MNKKFSELESADVLTGEELLAISQKDDQGEWQSKKVDVNNLGKAITPMIAVGTDDDGRISNNKVDNAGTVLIGLDAEGTSTGVAVGCEASAKGGSTAIGPFAKAESRSVAIGISAKATTTGCVAIGYGAESTHLGSIALGEGAKTTRKDELKLNNKIIGGVRAGTNDDDAVNKEQMDSAIADFNESLYPSFISDIFTGDKVIKPETENVKNVSYQIVVDSGTVTFDLSNFNVPSIHPRYSLRIVCSTNGGGYLAFKTGEASNDMYRIDGTLGLPEKIALCKNIHIYDVVLTHENRPALIKVYGAKVIDRS